MANLSFTSQGSLPSQYFSAKNLSAGPQTTQTTTPVSAALNAVQKPVYNPPPTIPPPTTPVKSTTVNNTDGSSHVTTYHAPDTGDTGAGGTKTADTTPATTFPGLIGSLANSSQTGSATTPGYIQKTADYGAGNIPIGQDAAKIAADYGKSIADVGGQGARFEAGQLTTGTSPVAEGNAAITAQTAAAEQAALASGESAALEGTSQELTGQGQAATAANAAAGQANASQGLKLTGLGTAAGLAAPQLGSIGQVPFSPISQEQGSPLGAPGGTAADAAKVAGQFQGAQALAAAPGQGAAQGQQALSAAGGLGTAGVLQTIPALQSASTAAEGISNTIQSYLQTNPTLNANTATVANLAQQWAQGKQLGNPAYQTLFNDLSEYANTLAPVLGVGGDPTNMKTQIAQDFINAQANGKSISEVLDNMNSLARNKISDIQSGATGAGTNVPAPNSTQNASSNKFDF